LDRFVLFLLLPPGQLAPDLGFGYPLRSDAEGILRERKGSQSKKRREEQSEVRKKGKSNQSEKEKEGTVRARKEKKEHFRA
jgi:hypothetical protein